MADNLDAALTLYAAGYCPIRVTTDGEKKPVGRWKQYQTERPTEDQVRAWFADGYPGIGIVTGAASGNAEMLEFEGRAIREGVFAAWGDLMDASGLGDIKAKLVGYADWTPKGGIHLHYRVDGRPVPGNTKLARRPSNAEELAADPDDKPSRLPDPDRLSGLRPIPVCQTATDAIRQGQRDRNAGKVDALDGHALLTRERIAAALGLLNGHYGITDEDWTLAGTAIAVSDATRAGVVATLNARQKRRTGSAAKPTPTGLSSSPRRSATQPPSEPAKESSAT